MSPSGGTPPSLSPLRGPSARLPDAPPEGGAAGAPARNPSTTSGRMESSGRISAEGVSGGAGVSRIWKSTPPEPRNGTEMGRSPAESADFSTVFLPCRSSHANRRVKAEGWSGRAATRGEEEGHFDEAAVVGVAMHPRVVHVERSEPESFQPEGTLRVRRVSPVRPCARTRPNRQAWATPTRVHLVTLKGADPATTRWPPPRDGAHEQSPACWSSRDPMHERPQRP
eukprot:149513-Prorocentrum_minimum.AAC.1